MNKRILRPLAAATALLALTGVAQETKPAAPAKPAAAPAAKPAEALFPDKALAKAKEFEIKQSQVDAAFTDFLANAAARGQQVNDERRLEVQRRILDRLIVVEILKRKATTEDKAKAKETVDKFLKTARERAGTDEAYARQIQAMGLTPAQFEAQITERALVEAVVDRELAKSIAASDEQAQKFYAENASLFEQPEQIRASHVLVATKDAATGKDVSDDEKKKKRETADKVLARAKAGEDFAKLAKEFSEDPGSKDQGGEYTFPRGQMVPEFEKAAFALQTNQVSEVVTTPFGYHVIKLSEKIPAKKVALAEVKDRIKERLTQQEVEKQLPAYLEKVKLASGVQILVESLKLDAPKADAPKGAEAKPAPVRVDALKPVPAKP